MSKSLEELQREYEKNTVKLEQEKRKLRRLENRKSYLDTMSLTLAKSRNRKHL